ncbi:MAG: hypothetical protein ACKVU2_07990 [Saprospiraceae bacterium]
MRVFTLWLWIAALLTSTVGISVTQIYCYCIGQSTYSIFSNTEDACVVNAGPSNSECCKPSKPDCCSTVADNEENDHACTKKTVKVFQLKADFWAGNQLEKTFDCPIWAAELPEYQHFFPQNTSYSTPNNKAPPSPPPPLSGRTICLRHELFRC